MARTRSRTGHGQLLLLAALLFGIVTMHTLGHPSGGHDGGHGGGAAVAPPPTGHGMPAGHGGGAGPRAGADAMGVTASHRGANAVGVAEPRSGANAVGLTASHRGTDAIRLAEPAHRTDVVSTPAPAHGADVVRVARAAPSPEPGHGGTGMDPLSVCLAVLGAFTLALLVRAGLLRPGGTLAHAPGLRRLLLVQRPQPPPPRALLSRLSVLRI
ncbi:hypothetical protein [Streptomyces sp. NPDC052114]|uniref:hypothetical protein n=1 Tax=unclassified Streptomyces TaxID=2593676 RepID=UPI00341F3DE0